MNTKRMSRRGFLRGVAGVGRHIGVDGLCTGDAGCSIE